MLKYQHPYITPLQGGDIVWHRRSLYVIRENDISRTSTHVALRAHPRSIPVHTDRHKLCLVHRRGEGNKLTFRRIERPFSVRTVPGQVLRQDAHRAFYAAIGNSLSTTTIHPFSQMLLMYTRLVLSRYMGMHHFTERKKEWISSLYMAMIYQLWVSHTEQARVVGDILAAHIAAHQNVATHLWISSAQIMHIMFDKHRPPHTPDPAIRVMCDEWMRIANHHVGAGHLQRESLVSLKIVHPTAILVNLISAP